MAAVATVNMDSADISCLEQRDGRPAQLASTALLDIVQKCLHARSSEWIFLRELRVGTGFRNGAAQRLDAFALNCFAHTSMKRVCYEIKTSRADFVCEMKQPLKRRIGLRYSNEFYFVTPAGLLNTSEIPIECGLVEIGLFTNEDRQSAFVQMGGSIHFDVDHRTYCRITVPAPWRDTPGPTWQFVAGMLRNQQKTFHGTSAKQPSQQRLPFLD
jgi:hypothetical protein